ncbi:MAG TPA: hypothetical protein VNQ90_01185, partial [Chthoniobacteraceae bacterium]|nr:hypothetical protein [Chthoniobacteraceae bacterium]
SLFLRPRSGSMMGESNSPGVSLRSTPGCPAVSPPGYSLADTTFNHTRAGRLRRLSVRRVGAITAASLAETFFWLAAWLPLPVRWGARNYRLGKGGRLRKDFPRVGTRG